MSWSAACRLRSRAGHGSVDAKATSKNPSALSRRAIAEARRFQLAVSNSSRFPRTRERVELRADAHGDRSSPTSCARITVLPWPIVLYGLSDSLWASRGREPVMRMSTRRLALSCQSGLVATLATPISARSRSIGSRSLRMSPLLIARFTRARIASRFVHGKLEHLFSDLLPAHSEQGR